MRMIPWTRKSASRAASMASLALAVICASASLAWAEGRLVRFTYGNAVDALPAIVGVERGYFAREGLIVSGVRVTRPAAAVRSLVTGSSDLALVSQRTLITMAESGMDFRIVAMGGWGTEMELVVSATDSKSTGLSDLKGKKIAVSSGSDALAVLFRLLNQVRMRPVDVTVVEMAPQVLSRALADGKVDAVFDARHITSVAMKAKRARLVMGHAAVTRSIGAIGAIPLIVNAALVKKDKMAVQRFVDGWAKAMAHIRRDPGDAAVLLQIYLHRQGARLSAATARSWIAMRRYDRLTWTDAAIADAEYNGWGLKTGGVLGTQPKIGRYVENMFAKQATSSLVTRN